MWKLAIQIDVASLNLRFVKLQHYISTTEEQCEKMIGNLQDTCTNLMRIIKKENDRLETLLSQMKILYKTPNLKRGLINAIGTISKTLFGTMDAEDEKTIYEQLEIINNNEDTLQHVIKNQLKVLQTTIGQMDKLSEAIYYNENLLRNVTTRMQQQLAKFTQREDLDEHLLVLTTIVTDLTRDIISVIDFLTYTKDGMIITKLLPLEKIINELKEAAPQLTKGLHFPFKIQMENWRNIQKHAKLSAYFDDRDIVTIIRFPVIAYPTYKLIKAVPFPTYERTNVFSFIKINHPLIAIDKENHHYILPQEDELKTCTQDIETYTCEQILPIYHIKANAPCEVQIYTDAPGKLLNCEKNHILSDTTLWISLTNKQSWLYSTKENEQIQIQCNQEIENQININGTGKIEMTGNCKLNTPDMIITTRSQPNTKILNIILPHFNITRTKHTATSEPKTNLRPIIRNGKELAELSLSLENAKKYLEDKTVNVLTNKNIMYPLGSGTIIVIIIAITIGIILGRKKYKNEKAKRQGNTERPPEMLY